jgi:hypothetical protein
MKELKKSVLLVNSLQTVSCNVKSDVLTAAVMKNSVLGITPRSPLKGNGRFGGTYRLNFQDRSIRQETSINDYTALYPRRHLFSSLLC